MKKIRSITRNSFPFLLLFLTVFSTVSCDNDFNVDEIESSGPPVVESVSEAREDIEVTQGVLESTYIIRGQNLATITAVYFNGVRGGFNPALGTNNIAFVSVPENAPYVGQDNIMRIENVSGFTEYDFSLLTIEDFTESTTDEGVKTVTLIGGDFTDTSKVTFVSGTEEDGTLVERESNIISVSETEVTVEVPDGIEQAYIFLETSRGAIAQSDSFGFSYSIFIDTLNPAWTMSQWGGTFDAMNESPALGQYSIRSVREAWSGLTFLPPAITFTQFSSITVSLYGTVENQKVNIALNDFNGVVTLDLIPNQWNKFVIPLRNFYPNGGAPAVINRIDFQEASNTGNAQYIFYVDDFGFL